MLVGTWAFLVISMNLTTYAKTIDHKSIQVWSILCVHHTLEHTRTHSHQICQIASSSSNNNSTMRPLMLAHKVRRWTVSNEPKHQTYAHTHVQPTRKFVLFVLLNLILCLHKGLYSINSCSIHSSNRTPIYAIRTFRLQSTLLHCVRVGEKIRHWMKWLWEK